MAFDLKAATDAAMSEAQRAPFEFEWGDEKFALTPMGQWPLEVSTTLTEMSVMDEADIDPATVVTMLRQVVGEDWPRFSRVIPLDAMPVLLTEMARLQLGGSMPDLSPAPVPALTPT